MSRRRRWTPVRGTGNRVYRTRERLLIAALDAPGRLLVELPRALAGWRQRPLDPASVREVLLLRLDRIGDVLMALPAIADLRAALPHARIRLAVGAWSQDVARTFPVDELLVWSAPWVGRADEGAESPRALLAKARALRSARLDLAIDLQGDVRAALLMRATGARARVGYANTGGAWLLTHVVPLDETVSWVEQNRRAVRLILPATTTASPVPLTEDDRAFARRLVGNLHLQDRRPLVGVHPSGGRAVKQWDVARWAEVAARLQQEFGATVVVTGSLADRPLGEALARALPGKPVDLTGRLNVRETMALIGALDLFLSPDTGPMHMACAVDTPSVSVFGPSDPARYFSGGTGGSGTRHVVVRAPLWCSPCNLIRQPPDECAHVMPECLQLVTPDDVHHAAARVLRETGGFLPAVPA
jgi:ADP-heptose:LPS heptosyltransferase